MNEQQHKECGEAVKRVYDKLKADNPGLGLLSQHCRECGKSHNDGPEYGHLCKICSRWDVKVEAMHKQSKHVCNPDKVAAYNSMSDPGEAIIDCDALRCRRCGEFLEFAVDFSFSKEQLQCLKWKLMAATSVEAMQNLILGMYSNPDQPDAPWMTPEEYAKSKLASVASLPMLLESATHTLRPGDDLYFRTDLGGRTRATFVGEQGGKAIVRCGYGPEFPDFVIELNMIDKEMTFPKTPLPKTLAVTDEAVGFEDLWDEMMRQQVGRLAAMKVEECVTCVERKKMYGDAPLSKCPACGR